MFVLRDGSPNICLPKATAISQETQAMCDNQLITSYGFAKHLKQCMLYTEFRETVTEDGR